MTTQTIGNNPNPDARYILSDSGTATANYIGKLTVEQLTLNGTATLTGAVTLTGGATFGAAITAGTGTNVFGAATFAAGAGTGVINVMGNINTQVAIGTAASSGNDVTEDTLFTFTLPASTLSGTKVILVTAAGTLKNDASTKTTKMYFGTTVFSVGTGTQANISWFGQMQIVRSGASTQIVVNTGMYGATAVTTTTVAGADTDTGGIVIKATGQNTGTASVNAVQGNFFQVTVEN